MSDQRSEWLTLGARDKTRIRADQIAALYDNYANGWQHYVTVTLLSGEKIKGEVTNEEWSAFQSVLNG